MKVTIANGNAKLGKVPNISLPPVETCPPGVPCAAVCQCYAIQPYRVYPNTKKAWKGNLILYKEDPLKYFDQIYIWVKRHKPEMFRWHVSGDIPDSYYWEVMQLLAEEFSEIKFLVYTKNFDLDFSHIPSNLSTVLSMWPSMENPKGLDPLPRAWMQDGTEDRVPADAWPCESSCEICGICWKLKELGHDVVFQKH